MSSSSSYNPSIFGFNIQNFQSYHSKTISIIWQSPQSGFMLTAPHQGNYGLSYSMNNCTTPPSGTTYVVVKNQQVWTANVDLYSCGFGVIVTNVSPPIYFSVQIDGQTYPIQKLYAQYLCPVESGQTGTYYSSLFLPNDTLIVADACSSFGNPSPGDVWIPLTCPCGCCGFCANYELPPGGQVPQLVCPSPTSSTTPPTTTIPPSVQSLSQLVTKYCTLSKFLNMPILGPPSSKSVISSTLWNNIVNNLYSAYNSLTQVLSSLSYANYTNLLDQIYTIFDAFSSPTPYEFTPLLKASKGTPLTAQDFNNLVNALETVYAILNKSPPYSVSPAFADGIVRSETFAKIVNNVNSLRNNALQSVLLLSSTGYELSVLPSSFTGQNVFVCSLQYPTTLSGNMTIQNLLIYLIISTLTIGGNTSISQLIVQDIYGGLTLQGTTSVQSVTIGTLAGTLTVAGFASIQNLFVDQIPQGGQLVISDNAYIQNLVVNNCQSGSIQIGTYALVNNLGGMAEQCVATYSS